MSNLITIEGFFQRAILKDEKSGKTLFSIVPEKISEETERALTKYGTIACKGVVPPYNASEFLAVTGFFEEDKYGLSLIAQEVKAGCRDRATSIRYLTSSVFALNYTEAEKIVDKLGFDLYAFAQQEKAVEKLSDTLGISNRRASMIVSTILQTVYWRELMDYGFDKDLRYNTIQRLIKDYGAKAKEVLCKNPYEIGVKYGASFECCDRIAFDNGYKSVNRERIRALAKIELANEENSGNVFVYERDLYQTLKRRFAQRTANPVPTAVIASALNNFRDIYADRSESDAKIYLSYNRFNERNVAKQIARLIKGAVDLPYSDDLVAYAETVCKKELADEQRESFNLLRRTGVAILTGGPGTGKTTTIMGLISAYLKMMPEGRIKLCAPSGRAAQRMSESTKMEATTIHRLVEYKPFEGGVSVCRDFNNPIEADLIILDESSMADLSIVSMLLSAVPTHALVLMVGDINQLQSVGAGDVLNDCINCGMIPVVQLKRVYRQAADSPIISNAYAINSGRCNLIQNEDFEILQASSSNYSETIKNLVVKHYRKDDPFNVQVLCPTHKGEGGVTRLNKVLQAALNPSEGRDSLYYGNVEYRVNDKIIMTKNNPDVGFYNGDIGVVVSVGEGTMTVRIQEKEIVLNQDTLDYVKLAYAMTIHKSQGSEFPVTIISMPMCNMLQRNLLYTAVTRGKNTVIIVEEEGCVERAIMKSKVGKRNSNLAESIRKEFEQ